MVRPCKCCCAALLHEPGVRLVTVPDLSRPFLNAKTRAMQDEDAQAPVALHRCSRSHAALAFASNACTRRRVRPPPEPNPSHVASACEKRPRADRAAGTAMDTMPADRAACAPKQSLYQQPCCLSKPTLQLLGCNPHP